MRRPTKALIEVAIAMMEDPNGKHWGYGLMKRSGLRSGVLYPILDRLLTDGWVTDGWEEPDPNDRRRARRRYYELTDLGKLELGALVDLARSGVPVRAADLGWAQ